MGQGVRHAGCFECELLKAFMESFGLKAEDVILNIRGK